MRAVWRSTKKFGDSDIGSSMRVLGDTSVEFIEQSSVLNRKIGVKGRSKFFPENEQGGGEWAVFKRYGCSDAYPIVQKHILSLIGESNSLINYGVQVRVLQYEAKVYATLCRKLTYRSVIWTRAESARQCVREY